MLHIYNIMKKVCVPPPNFFLIQNKKMKIVLPNFGLLPFFLNVKKRGFFKFIYLVRIFLVPLKFYFVRDDQS